MELGIGWGLVELDRLGSCGVKDRSGSLWS